MANELTDDLYAIQTALGASAAFRTWAGETTEALAKAHVHLFAGDTTDMPIAVVSLGSEWTRDLVAMGEYDTLPQVRIEFVAEVDKDTSDSSVFVTLSNSVSAIMASLEAQSATGWQIGSWGPADEDTPIRAKHSAAVDLVSFTVLVEGIPR